MSTEKVDVAAQDKPFLLNDMGGDVRVKKESGSLKYVETNYTRRSAPVQCSTYETIQNHYTHQSIANRNSIISKRILRALNKN